MVMTTEAELLTKDRRVSNVFPHFRKELCKYDFNWKLLMLVHVPESSKTNREDISHVSLVENV